MLKKPLTLKKAMDLMHLPNTRLVRMFANGGQVYFLIPGGLVDDATAEKIKARPDVIANPDGLFPGINQTWRIVGIMDVDSDRAD